MHSTENLKTEQVILYFMLAVMNIFIFMHNLLSLVEGWGYCIANILG
jgi:hypothetical protein